MDNLLAREENKKRLEKLINQFYYSSNYFVNDKMQVENSVTGKKLDGVVVVQKGKRWQFGC